MFERFGMNNGEEHGESWSASMDRQGDSVSIPVALSAEVFETARFVPGISEFIIAPLPER
jgi:hypothetical protein